MTSIKDRPKPGYLEDPEIKERIQEILYPYLSNKEAVVAIRFGIPREKEKDWSEAVGFASAYKNYRTTKVGPLTMHRVEFRPDEAREIHQLYELLKNSPHLEIFIDGMKLPGAATLWLPLLWFYF